MKMLSPSICLLELKSWKERKLYRSIKCDVPYNTLLSTNVFSFRWYAVYFRIDHTLFETSLLNYLILSDSLSRLIDILGWLSIIVCVIRCYGLYSYHYTRVIVCVMYVITVYCFDVNSNALHDVYVNVPICTCIYCIAFLVLVQQWTWFWFHLTIWRQM